MIRVNKKKAIAALLSIVIWAVIIWVGISWGAETIMTVIFTVGVLGVAIWVTYELIHELIG